MNAHQNPEPNTIVRLEWFFCIDVDRTTLKTTTLFERYIEPTLRLIAEEQSIEDGRRDHRLQIIDTLVRDLEENVGKSFDFLSAYNERVAASDRLTVDQLADRLIERISLSGQILPEAIEEILAPKTFELLQAINQIPNSRWGFLTSGGIQTQTLKLVIYERILLQELNMPLRAQVISTEHKTRDVDSIWRQADGTFKIPPILVNGLDVVASKVVVIDDKTKNLTADNMDGITPILAEQLDAPDDEQPRQSVNQILQWVNNIDK